MSYPLISESTFFNLKKEKISTDEFINILKYADDNVTEDAYNDMSYKNDIKLIDIENIINNFIDDPYNYRPDEKTIYTLLCFLYCGNFITISLLEYLFDNKYISAEKLYDCMMENYNHVNDVTIINFHTIILVENNVVPDDYFLRSITYFEYFDPYLMNAAYLIHHYSMYGTNAPLVHNEKYNYNYGSDFRDACDDSHGLYYLNYLIENLINISNDKIIFTQLLTVPAILCNSNISKKIINHMIEKNLSIDLLIYDDIREVLLGFSDVFIYNLNVLLDRDNLFKIENYILELLISVNIKSKIFINTGLFEKMISDEKTYAILFQTENIIYPLQAMFETILYEKKYISNIDTFMNIIINYNLIKIDNKISMADDLFMMAGTKLDLILIELLIKYLIIEFECTNLPEFISSNTYDLFYQMLKHRNIDITRYYPYEIQMMYDEKSFIEYYNWRAFAKTNYSIEYVLSKNVVKEIVKSEYNGNTTGMNQFLLDNNIIDQNQLTEILEEIESDEYFDRMRMRHPEIFREIKKIDDTNDDTIDC